MFEDSDVTGQGVGACMREIPASVFPCTCGGAQTISEVQIIGSRLEVNFPHVESQASLDLANLDLKPVWSKDRIP